MEDFTAWLNEQGIPLGVMKQTPEQRQRATAKLEEISRRACEAAPRGAMVTVDSNTGKVTVTTSEEIDLEEECDQEPPGSEKAIAIAAKLEAYGCGRQRRATPVIRRTRTRARSNLRSGRPSRPCCPGRRSHPSPRSARRLPAAAGGHRDPGHRRPPPLAAPSDALHHPRSHRGGAADRRARDVPDPPHARHRSRDVRRDPAAGREAGL